MPSMPSQRRIRLLFYVLLAAFVSLLFFTSHLRQSRTADSRTLNDFYHKTVNGIDRARGREGTRASSNQRETVARVDHDNDGDIDKDDARLAQQMADRLKAAEKKAKDIANAKAPNRPDSPQAVIGVGSSASGQGKEGEVIGDKMVKESNEDHAVEQEINSILKQSPVIIFSKSYCPHSKRAKALLLERYDISPKPFVVELDLHPLGSKIQQQLARMTGRRTVPNIMVNGKSIGGNDDIQAIEKDNKLVDTIKSLGGKRVEMTVRLAAQDAGAQKPL